MSLNLSMRVIIKVFLCLQLLLLCFRQVIDFAGIQWLMILVNLLAIIVTISAFFGFLKFYFTFNLLLIVYNLYVIGVYGRLIQLPATPNPWEVDDEVDVEPQVYSEPTNGRSRQPSFQLLSLDTNSRSYWHIIVANHISELHGSGGDANTNLLSTLTGSLRNTAGLMHQSNHQSSGSSFDDSLVDLCVQYIEIAIATLHILISLLGVGLILLKFKLARDKLTRNNDKTTPPLPPYTISPQMNHYMSYTGLSSAGTSTNDRTKGKLYQANDRASLRRMKRHRRSTRSLANNRSKANSMGNLVTMRDRSGGSLRSVHRKSTTSLLLNDTIDYNNTTIGSRRSGDSGHNYHHHQQLPQQSHRSSQRNLTLLNTSSGSNYQSLPPPPPPDNNIYQTHHQQQQHHHQMSGPPLPPPPNYHYHNNQGYNNNHNHQQSQQTQQHQQQQQQQPSHGTPGARYSTASSSYQVIGSINGNRGRYLPSDSDTEFYHTFTTHPGMVNPLYGNRNSYLNDSETAI